MDGDGSYSPRRIPPPDKADLAAAATWSTPDSLCRPLHFLCGVSFHYAPGDHGETQYPYICVQPCMHASVCVFVVYRTGCMITWHKSTPRNSGMTKEFTLSGCDYNVVLNECNTHTHTHSFDQWEDLLRCRQVTRDYDSKFPSPLVPTTTAKYVCGLSSHVKKKAYSSKTKTKATLKLIMEDLSDKYARWECSEITYFQFHAWAYTLLHHATVKNRFLISLACAACVSWQPS